MSRRRRTAAAVTGAVLGMTAISASALTPPATPPLPLSTSPTLGDQPQVPVGHCSFPRLGAGEIRTLISERPSPHDPRQQLPRDTVDPFTPCHILQVPDGGHSVVRSDDSGRHFTTVLAPPAGWLPVRNATTDAAEPVTLSAVVTPAPGEEYVFDTTGPYGVLHSGDGGVHWEQRNQGLPLVAGVSTLRTLAFAPSNPRVGYVVVAAAVALSTSTTQQLFQTADGGGTWSLVPVTATTPGGFPAVPTAITAVAVDPGDERHVFVTDAAAVWESADAGSVWSRHPLPPTNAPLSLLVTRPRQGAGHVRLYVKTNDSGEVDWLRSFDGGATWLALPVSPSWYDQALIADPTDADRMLLAATVIVSASGAGGRGFPVTLYTSQDGFATVQLAQRLPASWSWVTSRTDSPDPLRLTADHSGDFFLEVGTDGSISSTGETASDHLFAFRFGGVAALASSAPPANSPGSPIVDAPAAAPLHQCPLPSPFPSDQPPPPTPAGSLTYDGHYLDYTQDDITPAVAGLIERLDPVTCRRVPPLRPALPGDPTNHGAPPVIQQLTYDAWYVFHGGHQGAVLVLASRAHSNYTDPFPIYAVDPLNGAVELALVTPPNLAGTSFPNDIGYPIIFSYDVGDDDLWVSLGGSIVRLPMPAAHGSAATATSTCVNDSVPPNSIATVQAVAGDGMYVHLEDDTTVVHINDRSCTVLGGFVHSRFTEPPDENEQIACDPITDGDASTSRAVDRAPTSLLWIRDSVGNSVSAYAIPDGFCPFPTKLALLPSGTVPVATPESLCAVLRRATADRIPIPDQAVSFRIDGQPVGVGHTDPGGRACTTTTAPAVAGGHRVDAHFGGTPISFLPSSAEGPLATAALTGRVHAGPAAPVLVAVNPPLPIPQPLPQAQIAGQTQAEAQVQAQAQPQTVTQMQPGVMAQRQQQRQVAVEMLPTRMRQPVYQASALRPGRRLSAAPVTVAVAVLLSFGLLARRRAWSTARVPSCREARGGGGPRRYQV